MKRRLAAAFTGALLTVVLSNGALSVAAVALPHSHAKATDPTDWLDKSKEVIEAGAIIVGGIWTWMLFVSKRQRYPRASITHSVEFKELDDGYSLVHVTVTVKNPGEVLLSLISHFTRLQIVVPPEAQLLADLRSGKTPVRAGETEYPWPMSDEYRSNWSHATREIEPGESQDVDVDFFVPNTVETVLVYSYFKNKKKKNREIGWDCTTLHDRLQANTGPGSSAASGNPAPIPAVSAKENIPDAIS